MWCGFENDHIQMSHLRVYLEYRDATVIGEKDRDLAAFTDDMASCGNQIFSDGKTGAFATDIARPSGSLNDDEGLLYGSCKVPNADCGRGGWSRRCVFG